MVLAAVVVAEAEDVADVAVVVDVAEVVAMRRRSGCPSLSSDDW